MDKLSQIAMLVSSTLGILAVLAGVANAFVPLWGKRLPRVAAIVGGLGPCLAHARRDLAEAQRLIDAAEVLRRRGEKL